MPIHPINTYWRHRITGDLYRCFGSAIGKLMLRDDYSKPLEVRWLCRAHHMQHHAKEKAVNDQHR